MYCDEHTPAHRGDTKPTKEKGYGRRWQKGRAVFLKKHPLCVRCTEAGKLTPATIVDHIVPHRGDPVLFWDESNWQPLCKSCHDIKTMTDDRYQNFKY
jgi:5-methylcytosine-specific restriction protein A